MQTKILILQFIVIFAQENGYENLENLRRRNVIPLHEMNRRHREEHFNNNYRRTKDIQDDLLDRNFEASEAKAKEAERIRAIGEKKEELDKLQQELRWLTINTEQGIGIGI